MSGNALHIKSLRLHSAGVIITIIAAGCSTQGLAAEAASQTGQTVTLEQGWSPEIRDEFYYTPQGSQLIPYDWFLALERADDNKPFAGHENLSRYDWSWPLEKTALNPDDLPVGFVKDPAKTDNGQWLGMTCSACHTGDLNYKGATVRVDGAPSLVDLTEFLIDLNAAVQATLPQVAESLPGAHPEKFQHFAAKVLSSSITPDAVKQLAVKYMVFATEFAGVVHERIPSLAAGRGRIDALTQIINALSVDDLKEPLNLRDPSAPVSYPFLWLAPKLDFVQWNPVAASPIGRNAGEVLGVFGHSRLTGAPTDLFHSTVLYKNLGEIESWLWDLKPPVWPEHLFGQINGELADKGKKLFDRDCRGCHNMQPFDMTSPQDALEGKTFIKIGRTDYKALGVDPVYIESLIRRTTLSDQLAPVLFNSDPVTLAADFFGTAVGATVNQGLNDEHFTNAEKIALNGFREYPPHSPKNNTDKPVSWSSPTVTALKSGPLYGVWATGPFLHNGSVPNLEELLSPPEKRSKVFWVGSHEFDPGKLGYRSAEHELTAVERAKFFRFDTALPGNGNGGHTYPTMPYEDLERAAVLEYLKAAKLDEKEE